jgi:threonine synthase
MDVGAPSNFERLLHMQGDDAALRASMRAFSVGDARILAAIDRAERMHGYVPCPHTATALDVVHALHEAGDARRWTVVATAHPAKFEGIVEPRIGRAVDPPPALADSLARSARAEPLAADYDALRERLLA